MTRSSNNSSSNSQPQTFILKWFPDPCSSSSGDNNNSSLPTLSHLVLVSCPLKDPRLFFSSSSSEVLQQFHQAGHKARIALADLFVRGMMSMHQHRHATDSHQQQQDDEQSLMTSRVIPFVTPTHGQDSHSLHQDPKDKELEDLFACTCHIAQLDSIFHKQQHFKKRGTGALSLSSSTVLPYILERTDVYCTQTHLCVKLRVTFTSFTIQSSSSSSTCLSYYYQALQARKEDILDTYIQPFIIQYVTWIIQFIQPKVVSHIAWTLLQSYIRTTVLTKWDFTSTQSTIVKEQDQEKNNHDDHYNKTQGLVGAVAFIANGSILPRKSGNSVLPMSKEYAIPFIAPQESCNLYRELHINLGFWNQFIVMENDSNQKDDSRMGMVKTRQPSSPPQEEENATILVIPGMIIPKGVTLICGGGFHGKSTLLRTISMGIYDKIQGDGRELCITAYDALFVRSEDGRYVNHCNITAFMYPTSSIFTKRFQQQQQKLHHQQKDVETEVSPSKSTVAYPTGHLFSTHEASGSTSQASNVIEAIEFGATALLIDEDVSAANFMARDGRMRALVKDETITPLLYRVNGLYRSRQISSVIVIGGIGDWLDVPDNVILMDKKYQVHDALQRARSISHQFSYNHIQYGGRGVVHRLEWRKYEDGRSDSHVPTVQPQDEGNNEQLSRLAMDDINPRDRYIQNAQRFTNGTLALYQGGDAKFTITPNVSDFQHCGVEEEDDEYDDDFGSVDLSKCEQIAGRIWQVIGCALAVKWIMQKSNENSFKSIKDLIEMFELEMDNSGGSFSDLLGNMVDDEWKVLTTIGYALRPRKYEIASALARLRGGILLPVPLSKSETDKLIRLKEETDLKIKALGDLWSQRR